MQNINDYQAIEFLSVFRQNEIYHEIANDFDKLSWKKNFDSEILTPREYWGKQKLDTKFSMVSLYYIGFLLEKSPSVIYDIGCGWNVFKKYIKNIHGIDPYYTEYADSVDSVDDDFMKHREGTFESVFSICALHFYPIESIRKRVLGFMSMLQEGGRGYLSLNLQRMIEHTQSDEFRDPNFDFDTYVRNELSNMPFEYLVFDIDFSKTKDDSMDGNIRLVVEK